MVPCRACPQRAADISQELPVDRRLLDYSPVLELDESTEFERQVAPRRPGDGDGDELALAAELLSVHGAADLDAVLAKLLGAVGADGAQLIRTPIGRALAAQLSELAQALLPLGGVQAGAGGARRGMRETARPTNDAARAFGLELEGLSPEDREFELARQFVRFAGAAAHEAGRGARDRVLGAPRAAGVRARDGDRFAPKPISAVGLGALDPGGAARAALALAAREHAPGLLARLAPQPSRHGRWLRRGSQIIVLDC
jgi:hypothetical protein